MCAIKRQWLHDNKNYRKCTCVFVIQVHVVVWRYQNSYLRALQLWKGYLLGIFHPSKLAEVILAMLHFIVYHRYTRHSYVPWGLAFYCLLSVHARSYIRTYHGACILSFTICTHDARTYHGCRIWPFTVHARMTLVHTIAYRQCGVLASIIACYFNPL